MFGGCCGKSVASQVIPSTPIVRNSVVAEADTTLKKNRAKIFNYFIADARIDRRSPDILLEITTLVRKLLLATQTEQSPNVPKAYLEAKEAIKNYLIDRCVIGPKHSCDFNLEAYTEQLSGTKSPSRMSIEKQNLIKAFHRLERALSESVPLFLPPNYDLLELKTLPNNHLLNLFGINFYNLTIHNEYLFADLNQKLADLEEGAAKKLANVLGEALVKAGFIYNPDKKIVDLLNRYGSIKWLDSKLMFNDVYHIEKGAFGVVFRGKTATDEEVAIKRLNIQRSMKKDRERLINEFVLSREVRHPHIVSNRQLVIPPAYDISFSVHLVMEFCSHGDLCSFVNSKNQEAQSILAQYKLRWMIEVISALEALHAARISHADIKVENVVVDCQFRAKLTDFGLARRFEEEPAYSKLSGTITSCPPEVFDDTKEINPEKRDIWQFGVMMYELEVLRFLLEGRDNRAVIQKLSDFSQDAEFRKQRLDLVEHAPVRSIVETILVTEITSRPSAVQISEQLTELAYGH